MLKKLLLLFHTIRYLKPIQLYWRLYLKLNQFFPFSITIKKPINIRPCNLVLPIYKYISLYENQFCF